jgi:hypothetical protein
MLEAYDWTNKIAGNAKPVLVAYPLSFDWAWLYWYFVRFSSKGSPFNHSLCFDMKTAYAVKVLCRFPRPADLKSFPNCFPIADTRIMR